MLQRTRAYVLRSVAFGETSRISTVFSYEYGKFSLIAKGYRTPSSACARALEPFREIELVYYHRPDRELQIASQAEVIAWHPGIEERLDRFGYASAVLELCDRLLPTDEPSPDLYEALADTFEVLGQVSRARAALVFRGFQARACAIVGFLPSLEACAVCEGAVPAQRLFSATAGGFVCRSCASSQRSAIEITPEAAGLFRFVLRASAAEVARAHTPMIRAAQVELAGFIERFLVAHVEGYRGLRSLTMLGEANKRARARQLEHARSGEGR
jgi:DNA repair protein RecO (recombination protein O)